MLTSFRHAPYRWLWFSNLAGSAGRWALVLVLGTQLLEITHSSFWVGLGLFLTQGPVLLMAPFSGALADRFDRRTLNVASAAASSLTTALFAAATWLGVLTLPLMLCLSLLFGLSFVFQMTLRSTLVPSLVPPARLLNAVSLFQVATQGAQFLGPAVATPLLVLGGPAPAWCLCSLLYAAAAALCVAVGEARAPGRPAAARPALAASLSYLRARPLAWTAIWGVALHCSLTMAYQGMLPMFVTMDLGADPSGYGVLLTAIGVGAVTGSLCLAHLSDRRHRPALFAASLVGSGAALAVMGAAPGLTVAIVSGLFVGSTQAMFMSMTLALIQSSVDDGFRGRATSFYQMITLTPMALFGWGMGGLADVTEPRPLLVAGGLVFLVAMAAYASRSRSLRSLFSGEGWLPAADRAPAAASELPLSAP
ncbi:MAG TPA: MFS transporter [Candidatus Dormibacteraeota bacterium]|nr:MFS transporter [Candidatus Dormibacteraeota bacterium]